MKAAKGSSRRWLRLVLFVGVAGALVLRAGEAPGTVAEQRARLPPPAECPHPVEGMWKALVYSLEEARVLGGEQGGDQARRQGGVGQPGAVAGDAVGVDEGDLGEQGAVGGQDAARLRRAPGQLVEGGHLGQVAGGAAVDDAGDDEGGLRQGERQPDEQGEQQPPQEAAPAAVGDAHPARHRGKGSRVGAAGGSSTASGVASGSVRAGQGITTSGRNVGADCPA